MHRLRDAGNTLVVVEHDPAVMLAADRMIDMGPDVAGRHRGGTRRGDDLDGRGAQVGCMEKLLRKVAGRPAGSGLRHSEAEADAHSVYGERR